MQIDYSQIRIYPSGDYEVYEEKVISNGLQYDEFDFSL
jgi:hypothetical protein